MKPIRFLALLSTLAMTGAAAQAATVSLDVFARANSSAMLTGAETGITLAKGQGFAVSADPDDLWRIGTKLPRHEGNADDMDQTRLYTLFGSTFNHGTLVGRIGEGAFFKIGTFFSGVAESAGVLRLFAWDINAMDNSGFITAKIDVTAIPVPAGAPLLVAGLAALGLIRRRKPA
jgi:hypothetical protein